MRRHFLGLTVLTMSLSTAALAHPYGHGEDMVSYEASGWADDRATAAPSADGLLVDLVDDLSDADRADLERETGIRLESFSDEENGERFLVHGDVSSLADATRILEARPEVESVELNVYYSLLHGEMADSAEPVEPQRPGKLKPNDPLYKAQWHFNMVNAEGAWERARGEGVVVAVIDTGVSEGKLKNGKKSKYKRVPDLKETVIVPGYNFVNNKPDASDGNGHGTHVAGTIAQSTNNGFGVAGLAPNAKIMPVKVLSDRGWGSVGAITSGIRWAADNGANVINMSLGGGGYSASMAKAIEYAYKKGVIVICAAGNGGKQKVEFPAAYPHAVAVSALGPDGKLSFYSSYGAELDIAAPGGDTRVDLNKDGIPDGVLQDTIARGDPSKHGFFPFQGTSMATPHVAAAAALVMSTGVTDPDRVEEILKSSATDLKDPIRYGAGALNAEAAVKKAQQDKSLLSLGLAALFAFAAVRRQRRKDPLGVSKASPSMALGLVMGASGLFFLNSLGLGQVFGLGLLATPVGDWAGHIFGQSWHLTPVIGSFALALAPIALLFGVKKARPALAGFAFGVAGFLLGRALLGEVNVSWIPGHGVLDFTWLAVNGLIAAVLGRIALIRD